MKRAFGERRLYLLTVALLFAAACADITADGPGIDPRLGEQGLVRFLGPGCSSSTAMAVGSRAQLTLEPATAAPLPAALSVEAGTPAVIDAQLMASGAVELSAHSAGQSRIAVLSGGQPYDALTFSAEPAAAVRFHHEPLVLAGGAVDVVVTDVFGSCGSDACPLFGYGFIDWQIEPAAGLSLSFVQDDGGAATFRAGGSPGSVEVLGREPSGGALLVQTPLTVVPVDGVTGIAATIHTIPLEEGEVEQTIPLPGTVPTNTAFSIEVLALRDGEPSVALSRRDISWSIAGDSGVVDEVALEHGDSPMGALFIAGAAGGEVTLTAEIALLGRQDELSLTVLEPPAP